MILGVLSDTHGNSALMRLAVRMLVNRLHATRLIHLGDDWEDGEELDMEGYCVSAVPGLWCAAYRNESIPKTRIDEFEGLIVAYTHDPQALWAVTTEVDLMLCGHTHMPGIYLHQGVPVLNPGHLKFSTDRGQVATVGLIHIEKDSFSLYVYGLDGIFRETRAFPRSRAKCVSRECRDR